MFAYFPDRFAPLLLLLRLNVRILFNHLSQLIPKKGRIVNYMALVDLPNGTATDFDLLLDRLNSNRGATEFHQIISTFRPNAHHKSGDVPNVPTITQVSNMKIDIGNCSRDAFGKLLSRESSARPMLPINITELLKDLLADFKIVHVNAINQFLSGVTA